MKTELRTLLHPNLDIEQRQALRPLHPERMVRGIYLSDSAFAGRLVLPDGDRAQIYVEAEPIALRQGDIVIHRRGRSTFTPHFVAGGVIFSVPCLISTSDYLLRFNPLIRHSAEAIFCQLAGRWDAETPFDFNAFCNTTLVDPADDPMADQAVLQLIEAVALRREAQARALRLEVEAEVSFARHSACGR
jgi:hypothetical protein